MIANVITKKIGSKWHATIEGRPDLDETALTEEAARRKMEQLRDKLGVCGATTELFGGRTCELIAGHREIDELRRRHRSGNVEWIDIEPDDPRGRKALPRERCKLTRAA